MTNLYLTIESFRFCVFFFLAPKWRKVENENSEDHLLNNTINDDDDDDYDELLARHHRHMLEEQKDRK